MHVGLIIYGSLDIVSGGYLYDRQLVNHLRASGDTVQIISLPRQRYGRCLLQNFSLDLTQQMQSTRFDVLLQDELNHPSLWIFNRRLRRQRNAPIVSIVHHLRSSEQRPAWQNWFYRQIERAYLLSVDGFVFNSRTTRAAVEKLIRQERPFTIAAPAGNRFQTGLDEHSLIKRAQSRGPLRLLFVGNLIARKGLHVLLAALAQLPENSWELTIVGNTAVNPAYTSKIQQQSRLNGLDHRIRWRGKVTDTQLANELRRGQLLVAPSSYEGFGIVYLEGMAFGLPAVGTTAGAAFEIITNGDNGYLTAPDDANALAQAIGRLHQDRRLLAQMSLSAHRFFAAWPTWQMSMAQIRQFLITLEGS